MKRFSTRRRAQALIETAAMLPAILGLFFLSFTTFTHFSREAAYTRAASTLSEWVARTGEYNPDLMCARIADVLDGSLGVQTNMPEACAAGGSVTPEVFLYISVYPSDCDPKAGCSPESWIGSPLTPLLVGSPSDGTNHAAPAVAWFTPLSIPANSIVSIDIWSYQRIISVGGEASGFWITPIGHAISRSGQENTE